MIFQLCYIVLLTLIAHTIHGTQDVKSAREVARIQAHIDQKSNFLATLGTVLPRIQLQRLVLEYSKKPHLTPLVIPTFSSSPAVANAQSDTCYATAVPAASAGNAARALSMLPAQVPAPPASKRMTANASHHVTVAAPAAAADAAEGQTEPFAKDWREYTVSNIIALPNRGFALRRSTAIQTWQLQADNTARKGAIEHKTQRDTHYIHLTPLHDGTILSKIVAGSKWRNGVHHWNPYTNATSNALSADWKMRFPNQNAFISMALPLSTGKILLFFKDCSKVF